MTTPDTTAPPLNPLAAWASGPDDDHGRLVYADYLDEQKHPAGSRLRWWVRTAADIQASADWSGVPEWSEVEKAVGDVWAKSDRLCRLGGVLVARIIAAKYPTPWDKVTTWPEGWSSDRCKGVIADVWLAVEAEALGIIDRSARSAAESAAWSAAESAAESAAWSAARPAAESAVRAAWSAAWSAESAAWSAAWSARSAARSAESAESAAESAESAARAARPAARSVGLHVFSQLAKVTLPDGW